MQLVKNKFVKSGVVKYKDDKDNRLAIKCEKDGSSFNVVGTVNGHTFEYRLVYPYDYDGLNISYKDEAFITEEDIEILKIMITKIEDWVEIAKDLHILSLSNNDTSKYIEIVKKLPEMKEAFENKTEEECLQEIIGQRLTNLYLIHGEEMKEYVNIYLEFIGGHINV